MVDVRAMMDDDPKYQNLTKEEEAELIKNLRKFHGQKDLGVQASNRAAAGDVAATIRRIAQEVGKTCMREDVRLTTHQVTGPPHSHWYCIHRLVL